MTCHGCNQPLEPLAQIRTYHSGCDPQGRVEMLERTIKEMIEAIPGGHYCDPQKVADTLRAIADVALDYRPAQMKDMQADAHSAIRDLLTNHGVPPAAFIDDHVANAIAQRNIMAECLASLRPKLEGWLLADEIDAAIAKAYPSAKPETGG